MNWIKKGLIFCPDNENEWMKEYAQVPTSVLLGNKYRIYFTTRHYPNSDKLPVSNIGFIDVNRENPKEVISISENPVLSLGSYGSFDEFGLMPADIIKYDEKTYFMYYTGWTRMKDVPYKTQIGLAYSIDECNSFRKYSEGPIVGENIHDPILVNGPSIIKENGVFNMFYSSATKWIDYEGKKEVYYFVKHAKSENGIDWETNDKFCLNTLTSNEVQNAPRISKVGESYYLWFCYRDAIKFRKESSSGYKLGLAISKDMSNWKRIDEQRIGISKSNFGWDSEMMCYPYMIQEKNILRLFYNGNYFGKSGFGYAEMILN
jgi:predicted GH43/DUF377 family glycosyl hydrolase